MKTKLFWVIGLCVCVCVSCKKKEKDTRVPVPTVDTIFQNVSYGNNPALKMDLQLPNNRSTNTKLIILIHGGGWNAGDKNDLAFFATGWKARGFAVANINYRLSPQSTDNYKMQLDDIDAAVKFLNSNAQYYGYGSSFYMIGHSAGAHLSLSYAYTRNANKKIKAVGGMATPTDLVAGAGLPLTTQLITDYLGVPLNASSEARYKLCSPFYQASNSSVPTILFQGDLDFFVPKDQSISLSNKLTSLGVSNKLIVFPFVFHDWWGDANLVTQTLDETAIWFNQN